MGGYTEELYHYGIKGQQWGRRLYQNKDGSLTAAGKIRYGEDGGTKSYGKRRSYTNDGTEKKKVLYTQRRNGANGVIKAEEYVIEKDPSNKKNVLVKNVKSTGTRDGSRDNDSFEYTGGSVSMTKAEAEAIANSSYDDLSDEELNKLYKLTGDEEIIAYRKRRTARVVGAGKAYANSSAAEQLLNTVSAKLDGSAIGRLVNKGISAVAKLLNRNKPYV